jgi:hypothetical protein
MLPKRTTLYFCPTKQFVEATIIELTEGLVEQRIHRDWWADESLLEQFNQPPIDRHWNWNEMGLLYLKA